MIHSCKAFRNIPSISTHIHDEEPAMPCQLSQEQIDQTVAFHGHTCPGLTIGIRAAELALRELGREGADLLAVSETDMCGVDAVQFLTGCTYGKGNFIHRDYGKMAFSFFDRKANKGFRALLRPEARGAMHEEFGTLFEKTMSGKATDEDRRRLGELREGMQERLLSLELEEMFEITPLEVPPARRAAILESLACEHCGEMVMESRTRRFGGKTLCIPCFAEVEQKV
jgi:formylmethanofuran dehydrogenase subunit E